MSYLPRPLGAAIVRSAGISVAAFYGVPPASDPRALPRPAVAACCRRESTARPQRHASGMERVRGVSA